MPLHLASYAAAILLPPLCLLLLGIGGFCLLSRRPRLAKSLLGAMLVLLWVLSVPPAGEWLLLQLDEDADFAAPVDVATYRPAQAIVVLASGRYYDSHEYQADSADADSLERVRRAAIVHRQTGLPLLASGGRPEANELSLAALLKTAADEFGVSVKWLEEQSRTTQENARFTRRLLARERIDTIVLVTHGWHMPRARRAFERAGFKVIPAAAGLHHHPNLTPRNFLPTAEGLRNTEIFLHEVIGLLWYEVIGGVTT
ncbi:MAG: YdcF family protein [Betaproteobacteria bacterium]